MSNTNTNIDMIRDNLVVIKGTSKKNKPYSMLVVDKQNMFNSVLIQVAMNEGVKVVDLDNLPDNEQGR